jgi:predicted 3-demethylubiquinone-9 3-methyltransferase (glyoxalase superfamily)
MKSITPFVWFDGNAEEAARFYVSLFKNSRVVSIRRDGKRVLATTFRINGREFIAFNAGPHYRLTPAFSLFVNCESQREVGSLWKKLLKGGTASAAAGLPTSTACHGRSFQASLASCLRTRIPYD